MLVWMARRQPLRGLCDLCAMLPPSIAFPASGFHKRHRPISVASLRSRYPNYQRGGVVAAGRLQ
jgi:hypothetical protein